jgi:uncharacterized protein YbjT (DUF2867 family)
LKVLVTGANGFIGRHLIVPLLARGHQVVGTVRCPDRFTHLFPALAYVRADFTKDQRPEDWLPRLADIDVVVNTVGIFVEQGTQTFDVIHTATPRALFTACAQTGVQRVIQISALGADSQARSRFHLSKRAADDYLTSLDLDWVIVLPSLVFGAGGQSASLFTMLATMPLLVMPGKGHQRVQPIHVDDLTGAIVALLEPGAPTRCRIPAVGPYPVSFYEFFTNLRHTLGLPSTPLVVPIPRSLMHAAALLSERLNLLLLSREALGMLERGNTASPDAITHLLGRSPRPISEFIPSPWQVAVRRSAQLAWLQPLLRLALAFVWLIAGIVSLGIYPVEKSYGLLAATGITGILAPITLYGASLLDIALGLATLTLRRAHWLWLLQIGVIVIYSTIITWQLPEFWAHPFGPIAKNVPILALLIALLVTED